MNILVTGGAGYIGSHTIIELLAFHHSVVVIDNLCNSSQAAIERVEEITGISGNVDMDICYKDFPTIIKARC